MPKINPEFNLRMSLDQIISGSLFQDMSVEDIIRTIRAVADDFEKECGEQSD